MTTVFASRKVNGHQVDVYEVQYAGNHINMSTVSSIVNVGTGKVIPMHTDTARKIKKQHKKFSFSQFNPFTYAD